MTQRLTLLADANTTTTGTAAYFPGGDGTLAVWGTWDGASITFKYQVDETANTWITVTTKNADSISSILLPSGNVRCDVTVSGNTIVSARVDAIADN